MKKFWLVYESDIIGNSLSWRSWCYFEAQVWKKDSNIAPYLFFSHFFIWAFLFFKASFFILFYLGFFGLFYLFIFVWSLIPTCGGIIVSIILSSLGTMLYWMMIITLLFFYNSRITTRYLEQDMTLYECLRRCTGMCNDAWVTCMKELWTVALPQIQCQLHDHA